MHSQIFGVEYIIKVIGLGTFTKNLIFFSRDTMFVPIKRVLADISTDFFSGSIGYSTTLS